MATSTKFLRRDPRDATPWAETCGVLHDVHEVE